MVRNADEYVRKLSHGMVVTELENKGLMQAIRNLCERTSRATGINCTFSKDDGVEIEVLILFFTFSELSRKQ